MKMRDGRYGAAMAKRRPRLKVSGSFSPKKLQRSGPSHV